MMPSAEIRTPSSLFWHISIGWFAVSSSIASHGFLVGRNTTELSIDALMSCVFNFGSSHLPYEFLSNFPLVLYHASAISSKSFLSVMYMYTFASDLKIVGVDILDIVSFPRVCICMAFVNMRTPRIDKLYFQ